MKVELKYATSPLEYIPIIGDIQAKFDFPPAKAWLYNVWPWTIPLCVVYIILVFSGQKWMSSRTPYNLRSPLFVWNTFLALFSLCGSLTLVPHFIDVIYKAGFRESVCKTEAAGNPHLSLWSFLFVVFKVIELGDTAFVVLRKSPLQFLHYYHHMTVLMYAFYGLSRPLISALGIWIASINYSVHTVMYTYYAIRATGYHVPNSVSKCITLFQLSQMFVALLVNFVAYVSYLRGEDCDIDTTVFYIGMVIYGSYAFLFMKFFYTRYIRPTKTKIN